MGFSKRKTNKQTKRIELNCLMDNSDAKNQFGEANDDAKEKKKTWANLPGNLLLNYQSAIQK